MMDVAILILRLCLAIVFMAHGAQAAFGAFGGPGIDNFSKMLSGLGFKPALLWAYIGAYTQLFGGIFLLGGFFTRIAAGFILIFISVAAFKVHLVKGFFTQDGGFEYNFVLACVCAALVITGGGKVWRQRLSRETTGFSPTGCPAGAPGEIVQDSSWRRSFRINPA